MCAQRPPPLYRERMQDREIVAAIVAGEPAGLAAAYDQYAPALHAYCRSVLSEPADAADAVQDTFIIASAKLGGLRDPDRLRSWLYAVARNQCRRRLRARASSAPLDEAGEMTDQSADVGVDAERAELRMLVGAALAGLNPGEREIIELNLRHELDGADLADALGVPRNQAHALASRARTQFETSLGALLVARTGREDCPNWTPSWLAGTGSSPSCCASGSTGTSSAVTCAVTASAASSARPCCSTCCRWPCSRPACVIRSSGWLPTPAPEPRPTVPG